MNKLLFYSFIFAFCLGYITTNFIHESKLSPITFAHADAANTENIEDIEVLNIEALLQDLEFRLAVKEVVEDCIVVGNKISC